MKVRTQAGVLIDVSPVWEEGSKGKYATSFIDGEGRLYAYSEVTFPDDEVTPIVNNEGGVVYIDPAIDYWTRLEYQAAIAAMQGLCANYTEFTKDNDGTLSNTEMIVENARLLAHALVEKVRYEENPKELERLKRELEVLKIEKTTLENKVKLLKEEK